MESPNHMYSTNRGKIDLYQNMCQEFRCGDEKVLGTQAHLPHGLASIHCVSHPYAIKGSLVGYVTHTCVCTHIRTWKVYSNMYLANKLLFIYHHPSIHLTYAYINTYHIPSICLSMSCHISWHNTSYSTRAANIPAFCTPYDSGPRPQ